MASKKEDAFSEEYNRVEHELKQFQLELSDLRKQHDDLAKKLEGQEKELDEKDAILVSIEEGNKVELAQLELEAACVKEHFEHEVGFHIAEVASLKHRVVRLYELQAENERLESTVAFLEENISKDRREHAMQLHEMNKTMKEHRQHMESKLRKDLNGLDISFQNQAFAALHDRQKRAMFRNAKLKDEVAIQGIGISNLSTRLAKQKVLYDATATEHAMFLRESEKLKKKLGIISTRRNFLLARKQELVVKSTELKAKRRALAAQMKDLPQFLSSQQGEKEEKDARGASTERGERDDAKSCGSASASRSTFSAIARDAREQVLTRLLEDLSQRKEDLRTRTIDLELWKTRLRLLNETLQEIQPTTEHEKKGVYDAKSFPLFPLLRDINRLRRALCLNSSPSVAPSSLDIESVFKEDAELAAVLQALRAEENNIVVACNKAAHHREEAERGIVRDESSQQNMIAWTTLKILVAWYRAMQEASEKSQIPLSSSAPTDSDGSAYNDEEDDYEQDKLNHSGEEQGFAVGEWSLEEKMDALFESDFISSENDVLDFSDSTKSAPALTWLRTESSKAPFASLIAAEQEAHHLHDAGPPVVRSRPPLLSPHTKTSNKDTLSLAASTNTPYSRSSLLNFTDKSSALTRSAQTLSLPQLRATDPLLQSKKGGKAILAQKNRQSQTQLISERENPSLPRKKDARPMNASMPALQLAPSLTTSQSRYNSTSQLPQFTAHF